MSDLTATVAIVSYRTPELAARCLASILDQKDYSLWLRNVEIIFADHMGLGYAQSLDYVFRKADAPILVACNADVQFPDASILPLLKLFEQQPRLGVLGPRQRDSENWLRHCGIAEPGATDGGVHYGELDQGQCAEPFALVDQVSGSAMFIRREAYEAVGGFTVMPFLYYEDALLCLRMRRAGWRVGYSGLLTFTHDVASSPVDYADRARYAVEGRKAFELELAL